jgi:hypothetical protein
MRPPDRAGAVSPRYLAELSVPGHDPRHGQATGFGAEVVRRAQETLPLAAWEHV